MHRKFKNNTVFKLIAYLKKQIEKQRKNPAKASQD